MIRSWYEAAKPYAMHIVATLILVYGTTLAMLLLQGQQGRDGVGHTGDLRGMVPTACVVLLCVILRLAMKKHSIQRGNPTGIGVRILWWVVFAASVLGLVAQASAKAMNQ